MSSEDGSLSVVCDGEIHDYIELRNELRAAGHQFRTQSDTEVIPRLYEDLGAACLSRLRGAFALAVWDLRRRILFLARDRLGIKPLYYSETPDGLYFASEQKALLVSGRIARCRSRGAGQPVHAGVCRCPDDVVPVDSAPPPWSLPPVLERPCDDPRIRGHAPPSSWGRLA